MTTFGKILVFVNLVFSLGVGALVGFVYIARTNYAVQNEQLGKKLIVAQADSEQAQKARAKAEVELANAVKKGEADLKASEALLKAKIDELEQVNARYSKDNQTVTKWEAALKAAQLEVDRRQADVAKMRETLKSEMDKNIDLVKNNNTLKDNATAAQLQAAALLDRNKQLEGQVQDLARDVARFRSAGLAGATPSTSRNGANPPAEDVQGQIKTADPSGLVKLTIGSDAGLARGQTLEVFRLAAIPTQSKYLGRIRILEVTANEAVGQPTGRPIAPLQAGDRVASRILGS